jgi:hypothetical protein
MAQVIRETRIFNTDETTPQTVESSPRSVLAQIIYLIAGIIEALLTLRLILALLGANSANAFAHFIYSVTLPLVAPFFGLFNYQVHYGVVRFEFETVIAMVVYALIAWLLVRLLTIGRPGNDIVE